jgi:hypothetical protein
MPRVRLSAGGDRAIDRGISFPMRLAAFVRAAIRAAHRLLPRRVEEILRRAQRQNVDDTGDSSSKMDRRDNNGHDRKRGADAAAWWYCSARAADIGRGQARGRQRTVRCGAQRVVCCCRFGAAESTALTGSSGRCAGTSLFGIPVARITASERFAMAASAARPPRPVQTLSGAGAWDRRATLGGEVC